MESIHNISSRQSSGPAVRNVGRSEEDYWHISGAYEGVFNPRDQEDEQRERSRRKREEGAKRKKLMEEARRRAMRGGEKEMYR